MASLLRPVTFAGLLAAACAQRPGAHTVRRFLAASEDEPLVLAQTSVHRTESASGARNAGRSGREPLKAGWFDAFSQGESNYDMEGDRGAQRSDGWEYKRDDPYNKEGNVMKAVYYHESPSGGSKEAWQTHFPGLSGGPAGRVESTGAWHVSQGGHWVQDYQDYQAVNAKQLGVNVPSWFDSSIMQYDGFGREKSPNLGSPRLYADGFQERAVNTTIACKDAGCIAHTQIQAFNGNTEIGRECKLSLYLHPTDFDDEYSGERVTFIKVNGITVNTDCFPMVSGCNASAQSPLFSCLQELPLDHLIDATGYMNISAQISDVVDECPYQGNLLSGVPMVTCLVAPKPTTPPPIVGKPPLPVISAPPPEADHFYLKVPLHCPFRGCVANANLALGPRTAKRISRCMLTMKFYQTDFDNLEDTNEAIEYVQINGAVVASNLKPGKNPCRSLWAGRALALAETEHVALQDFDVTANATSGLVAVEAKITDHVDECAHDGYLLDGLAEMNCTLKPSEARETSPASSVGSSNSSNGTSLVQMAEPVVLPSAGRTPERRPEVRSSLRDALLEKLRR